jgi:outer membrane protein OmpA-like peptidoglycan-associated protein
MKCRVTMAVIITALTGIFLPAWAQKNYYVVVGAFSTEGNAKEFTTHLPSMNADTAYAMNDQNSVVHLYVLKTTSEEVAIAKSLHLQQAVENSGTIGEDLGGYESISIVNGPEGKNVSLKTGIEAPSKSDFTGDASSSRSSATLESGGAAPAVKPKSKMFKFTINGPEGQAIPGKVHFVDYRRERDLASYTASIYTDVINPGKNNDMALVCGIFGYKISEKYMDYSNPASIEGAYEDENGAWVIPYDLKRLEKGDVSVMYNVAFLKDAVIMLPFSQSDLDELVAMMKENPEYQITVHGHCNGKNDRKIIAKGSAQGFFDIAGSKQLYGSAKQLSSLRAEAVRDYLVRHDIDAKRIKTFAWGGRYMLTDPQGSYAKLNDRIEIEIRKD